MGKLDEMFHSWMEKQESKERFVIFFKSHDILRPLHDFWTLGVLPTSSIPSPQALKLVHNFTCMRITVNGISCRLKVKHHFKCLAGTEPKSKSFSHSNSRQKNTHPSLFRIKSQLIKCNFPPLLSHSTLALPSYSYTLKGNDHTDLNSKVGENSFNSRIIWSRTGWLNIFHQNWFSA